MSQPSLVLSRIHLYTPVLLKAIFSPWFVCSRRRPYVQAVLISR